MKSTKTTVEQKFLKFVQGNLYERKGLDIVYLCTETSEHSFKGCIIHSDISDELGYEVYFTRDLILKELREFHGRLALTQ